MKSCLVPGAIILALLTAACSGGNSSPATPTPTPTPTGPTTTVTIPTGARNLTTTAYAPNPVTVSRGASVTWVNNDSIAHTASSNDSTTFNSGTIAPGGSFSMTFQNAGTFPYRCTIHPNMVGTVTVQ
jgi:plastocyanin